ncbi:3-isopropylmalate dehydrogenase [Herbaspirillum sp. NPDC101396]|uniref:3-isopropylmalate dehydrogenase n=1 Tax=Herbaspirillum sp. NPDC101396 TaxID=3364005 RepID=UPI00383A8DCC
MKAAKIAVLPGDGVGQEVVPEAVKVLQAAAKGRFELDLEYGTIGMSGVEATGKPLPDATLALAKTADAILFGSVGGPAYEQWLRKNKVRSGLLQLRLELGLNANLRPVRLIPELASASTLKPEVIDGLDLLIIRELSSDIYFGEPRGPVANASGERESVNTMRYTESEVRAIAHVAFQAARGRSKRVCSVDKANVLETMQLWRDVMTEVGAEYPDIELSHLYIDAAAMALLRAPTRFDVIVTGNMFGDILSDEAAMLVGSLGMMPSASLSPSGKGLYEPIHGSAPDIAGRNIVNPLATILSAAMLLRYSLQREDDAQRVENAVRSVVSSGLRTADIMEPGCRQIGTREMGDAVAAAIAR